MLRLFLEKGMLTLAIDHSLLTIGLCTISALLCCIFEWKKSKNGVRVFAKLFWIISIYNIVRYCILPIQLTSIGPKMDSFFVQFSPVDGFFPYFFDYLFVFSQYIFAFFMFAVLNTLLFKKARKWDFSSALLLVLLATHLCYNVLMNSLHWEPIKFIRLEDFILFFIGYILGYLCAMIILKVDYLKHVTREV